MEELIYNLCDNAIRYNKKDGTVTVTTGIENGHTFLSVKDTGIGISAEHQERVFERFYRVDKSRSKATGGTGLGLAIVKHIVAQHGAKLTLESEQGKGTEIRVEFSEALKQHELETAKQRQEGSCGAVRKWFVRLKQKTDDLLVICDNIYKNYKICRITSKTR